MRKPLKIAVVSSALFGLIAGIGSAAAHHSRSMYDHNKVLTIVGTVKELRWVNPHVSLLVFGAAKGEEPVDWVLEMTSPGILTRLGWTRTAIKPGDRVEVEFNPLLNDQIHGGAPRKVTLADFGKSLGTDYRGSESVDNE